MIKRLIAFLTILLLASVGVAGTATAGVPDRDHGDSHGNPHFVNTSASVDSHGNLSVKVKEVGLGHNQKVNIKGKAYVKVTFACVKHHKIKYLVKTGPTKVYSDNAITTQANGKAEGTLTFTAPTGTCAKGYPVNLKVKWLAVKVFDTETHASDTLYGPWVWKAKFGYDHHHGDYGDHMRDAA